MTIGKKPAAKTAATKTVAAKTVAAKTKTAAAETPAVKKKPVPPVRKPGPKADTKSSQILFKAPADFKPAFFELQFESLRDGLIRGGSVKASRVKGKWDNPDAPRYDLAEYDLATLLGISARLGGMAMAPNIMRRLPPKSKFGMVIRVNKRAADGTLTVLIKAVKQLILVKDKPKWKWFDDKTDPVHRRLRRMSRALPGAFVEVQLPPSKRPKKADAEEA